MTALTEQEKKVLRLWLLGATSPCIADQLRMDREQVLDIMVVIQTKLDLDLMVEIKAKLEKPVVLPEGSNN